MNHTLTSYQETLDYLFEQLPMYQRQGKEAFKKDLTNIRALCEKLGNPQDEFNSVHIAGTNGKGTMAHLIACLYQQRGYKVGLYTSPHYVDFRERIKLNGEYIPEDNVVAFVNDNQAFFEKIKPSFFEITVAMAFDYFAKEEVDIAIIETGLGGRLDSTNIIRPDLSVITNISFDHQAMLGDSLPKIAAEKAGIIKSDVPVVIGETQQEVVTVFKEKAKAVGADITFADANYRAELKKEVDGDSVFTINRNGKVCYNDIKVNLQGPFQEKNMTTLFQCIESLNDLDIFKMIREYDIRNGLPKLRELTGMDGENGGKYSATELAKKVMSLWPDKTQGEPYVVCTGGEPLLQLDEELINEFHQAGLTIAVETNGTIAAPEGLDWICVSPKANAELLLEKGNELKLVYPQINAEPEKYEYLDFDHFFLQPMDGPKGLENTQLTLDYCLKNPKWRLSLQTHKWLEIK